MGDENAPCLAAAIPPGFIPPKLSRGLVRERRVGGLKPPAFGAGSKPVSARALRACTKPNPPFPEPPRCRSRIREKTQNQRFNEKPDWKKVQGYLCESEKDMPEAGCLVLGISHGPFGRSKTQCAVPSRFDKRSMSERVVVLCLVSCATRPL